jgi:hypothetical protein
VKNSADFIYGGSFGNTVVGKPFCALLDCSGIFFQEFSINIKFLGIFAA